MKCNHCNKTIPEVSINCPFCKEIVDPNAKPVVNFGELGLTDYDSKFDIKTSNYEEIKEESKSKKGLIIGLISGGVGLVVILLVFVLIMGSGTKSGYTYYKAINDQLFNFLLDNYTNSNEVKTGTYSLYFRMNEWSYKFDGNYGLDTKNKIITLDGLLDDPRENNGEVIIGNSVLKFDAYLENNYLYLLSEQLYDETNYLMLPIDDETGLLTTKKYDLSALINGLYSAMDVALSKATYKLTDEVIVHNGEEKKVKKYSLVLDNPGKQLFYKTFLTELLEDGSFVNEYARIQKISSSEAEEIITNYITSAEFKYSGKSDYVTYYNIYFNGNEVYRLELDMDEKKDRLIQIDIGKIKYYLEYFEGDKNVYSGSLGFTTEDKDQYIVKEYEITFDSDNYITDLSLSLKQNKSGRVKRKEIEKYKSIQEFEQKDYDTLKNKLNVYINNVKWVDNLQNIFREKCTPDLKCECPTNAKYCNCTYDNTIIVCPVENVKVTTVTTTTKTSSDAKTTTSSTVTTTITR